MANVHDDDEETLQFADEGEYGDGCMSCDGEGCDDCDGTGEAPPTHQPDYRPRPLDPTYGWHPDDRA